MALTGGKHVMLSYNHKSKNVVKIVYDTLLTENIPVWFDDRDMDDNMYDSMAQAVADAAFVCCFMTPEYENSRNCKLELQHAQTLGKRIIPCMVSNRKVWKPSTSSWLALITSSILAIDFSDTSEASIRTKAQDIIDKIKNQPSAHVSQKMNWFEPIRQTYLTDNKIRRVMDNGEYAIENSYINLAMVETKEQLEKEKKLKQHNRGINEVEDKERAKKGQANDGILSTYEEIYGVKTSIDVKDIFKQRKDQTTKVLVLGRAGIGKSTFCQYVTYLWAKGELWQEYELVILIILRKLTSDRYPSGRIYSPVDVIEREYFPFDVLSNEVKEHFRKQCNENKVLWILDGYDEFVQSKPAQLVDMFDYVHKKQHHILTSRPYSVDLSYDIKMEIIGFTDENIVKYAEEFFRQMKGETEITVGESGKILTFLRSNPNIWGIAHIPVNLELICTVWIELESSKTASLTVTQLYSEITEWFCRRYLEKQKKRDPCEIQNETRKTIFEDLQYCQKEILFLEHLAYKAMEANQIMIQSDLIEGIQAESKCNAKENSQLLNMGILKSYEETNASRRKQTSKQHYFVHLSFQEYFTARHLLKLLMGPRRNDGINFIKENKYNQRFHFAFLFATGLLAETDFQEATNIYWEAIEGEPLDLVGLKHIKLMIECIDQLIENKTYPQRSRHIQNICDSMRLYCSKKKPTYTLKLADSLKRATALIETTVIQSTLQRLLETNESITYENVLHMISNTSIQHPTATLVERVISLARQNSAHQYSAQIALDSLVKKAATSEVICGLLKAIRDEDKNVRLYAAEALGRFGEKAATSEVICGLLKAIRDEDENVRRTAAEALGGFGEKAATSEVFSALLTVLRDEDAWVRLHAAEALGRFGEKAATSEVICGLLKAIRDEDENVRRTAAEALGGFGEKAATSEVFSALLTVLRDEDAWVRLHAAEALGRFGEKAATSEVICGLLKAIRDEDENVRRTAAEALGGFGEKAATSEVFSALLTVLRDEDAWVRLHAAEALGRFGEKAATSEVICGLLKAIRDEDAWVRLYAAKALGRFGEKAATSEVICGLLKAIRDEDENVRRTAAEALGGFGEKAATSEVICALLAALHDESEDVRCSATQALGKLGEKEATSEVICALLAALHDESEDVRCSATQALGKLGEKEATSEVICALLAALHDESEDVRCSATQALGKLGEKEATSEVICALLAALHDESEDVRCSATQALGKLGEKEATSEVICAVLAAIQDESEDVRCSAAEAFTGLGANAGTSEVISRLLKAIRDDDKNVRCSATEALRRLAEKAATSEVISRLLTAIRDEDSKVRCSAAGAFGRLGQNAGTSEVISALLAAIRDENSSVRCNAAKALGRFGEKAATSEVFSALLTVLRDEDDWVRWRAAGALGELGQKAASSEVILALLAAVQDENPSIRCSAATALGRLGGIAATNEVICSLLAAIQDESQDVRCSAADALGRLGEKAATSKVISAVLAALRTGGGKFSREVGASFQELCRKGASSEVISVLLAAVRDEHESVFSDVGEALVGLGGKAATIECAEVLLNYYCEKGRLNMGNSDMVLKLCFLSYDVLKQLNANFISKLCRYVEEEERFFDGSGALYQFLRLFLDTGNEAWLRASFFVALTDSIAVVVSDRGIRFYDGSGSREVHCQETILLETVVKEFGLLKQNFLNTGE